MTVNNQKEKMVQLIQSVTESTLSQWSKGCSELKLEPALQCASMVAICSLFASEVINNIVKGEYMQETADEISKRIMELIEVQNDPANRFKKAVLCWID